MNTMIVLVLLSLIGSTAVQAALTCSGGYTTVAGGHSICLPKSPNVITSGVTPADALAIVDKHNALRRNPYPKTPAEYGSRMPAMVWDDNIASIAQKYAETCNFTHDTSSARKVLEYGFNNGQNLAMGYTSWTAAIDGWFSEVSSFTYGANNTFSSVGHYTQIVYEDTTKVGCGFAECTTMRIFVCNYGIGQMTSKVNTPFTKGAACANCPLSCSNSLCDCGGKICENGGTIDINKCNCSCTALYKGPTCNQVNCPANDASYCGTSYPPSYCTVYTNVPQECPFMCGLCSNQTTTAPPTTTATTTAATTTTTTASTTTTTTTTTLAPTTTTAAPTTTTAAPSTTTAVPTTTTTTTKAPTTTTVAPTTTTAAPTTTTAAPTTTTAAPTTTTAAPSTTTAAPSTTTAAPTTTTTASTTTPSTTTTKTSSTTTPKATSSTVSPSSSSAKPCVDELPLRCTLQVYKLCDPNAVVSDQGNRRVIDICRKTCNNCI